MKVNQPASFAVSLNGAKGVIDAKVHSPSGALEECCVTEIDQGNPLESSLFGENPAYMKDFSRHFTFPTQISMQCGSSPERTASI